MGPLATALLSNAEVIAGTTGATGKLLGAVADNSKIKAQARIEQATNGLNAATQRVGIAQNYTGIFEKMVSDLSTQNNLLATAGVDKASTLFMKSRQAHEKAFLDNKANMERDLQNLSVQKDIANQQSKITMINKKQENSLSAFGGMADSFTTWKGYGINLKGKIEGLKK